VDGLVRFNQPCIIYRFVAITLAGRFKNGRALDFSPLIDRAPLERAPEELKLKADAAATKARRNESLAIILLVLIVR
jgi:hypothetical protein